VLGSNSGMPVNKRRLCVLLFYLALADGYFSLQSIFYSATIYYFGGKQQYQDHGLTVYTQSLYIFILPVPMVACLEGATLHLYV
jgi:hypothetical protein